MPYLIRQDRFDNSGYLSRRLVRAPVEARANLRKALRFLYFTNGPTNLQLRALRCAAPFLLPAEEIVCRWLYKKTTGQGRRIFGATAMRRARAMQYRCEDCGHSDVRVLQLHHVNGRLHRDRFACLCANCHVLLSRQP